MAKVRTVRGQLRKAAKSTSSVTEDMQVAAERHYYRYSVAVNEDRAVPGDIDGLKPVSRRCLWAIYKLGGHSKARVEKSALYVGEVIGRYHPHGDKAVYDAMVTMVNSPQQMIYGEGNWGSLSDSSVAAYRYTNLRMSAYAQAVFFDPFYLPVLDYVPTYDASGKEPVVLPSLLPNLLLNGNFGIGVGVRTEIPSYTLESIVKLLSSTISGDGTCTVEDCLQLKFSTLYGGVPVLNKAAQVQLYSTGKGRVEYQSVYENAEKNAINITKFAPFAGLTKAIERAGAVADVLEINDISDVADRHGRVYVRFRPSLTAPQVKAAADKLMAGAFGATESYDVKVTTRQLKKSRLLVKLKSTTVPDLLNQWIEYRLQLEQQACAYWITQRQADTARLELLRKAISHIDTIVRLLKDKKVKDAQLAPRLAAALKITVEQANVILDLQVRRLRRLNDADLKRKIAEIGREIAGYQRRIKDPGSYVVEHLGLLAKQLKNF